MRSESEVRSENCQPIHFHPVSVWLLLLFEGKGSGDKEGAVVTFHGCYMHGYTYMWCRGKQEMGKLRHTCSGTALECSAGKKIYYWD